MESSSKLIGIHGRLRRRVTTAGGGRGNRVTEFQGRRAVNKDKYLHVELRDGTLSEGEIRSAVEAFNKDPYTYSWLREVSEQALDRADGVFFVRYGRHPTMDTDFKLNGHYHRICKSLQYDAHHHDAELSRLRWDRDGNPYVTDADRAGVLRDVERVAVRRGSTAWSVAFVALALLGAAAMVVHIVYQIPAAPSVLMGLCCIVWILLCLTGLVIVLPRYSEQRKEVAMCSKCHKELDPSSTARHCPNCNAAFDSVA